MENKVDMVIEIRDCDWNWKGKIETGKGLWFLIMKRFWKKRCEEMKVADKLRTDVKISFYFESESYVQVVVF